MVRILGIVPGGIARDPRITSRGAVKDRQTAAGGERVFALVLDGEHDVIG
ncbi:MAG: hypothetical protein M3Z20_19310 [Chloroflexota bacterium]|nr:hypothetical protein [Chloroflexota bacterium]